MTRTTYFITCSNCDLNKPIETEDWKNGGVLIKCCECAHEHLADLPPAAQVIRCPKCGTETWIQKIDIEV